MSRSAWTATALAGAAVAGTLRAARGAEVPRVDVSAARIVARPRGHSVDRAAGALTDLGSVFGLVGVGAALGAAGHRREAAEVVVAGGLAWGLAQGAKELVHRPRPYEAGGADRLVSVPAGSSWPSGHTAVAAATAASLAPSLPAAGIVGAAAAAAMVATSRVYVGVHYLTDVLAGAGVGVIAAAVAQGTFRALVRRPG